MAGKGEGPAIGIDLETAYSCVGVWQHDRVEIVANDQGNRTTPSYVAFTDSERLIGDAAKNQVAMNPINTVFDFSNDDGAESKGKGEAGKSQQLPFLPKEEELSGDELERILEERYRSGSQFVRYADDDHEMKRSEDGSFVLPSLPDPPIWKVKCKVGREKHTVFCLMQKYVDLKLLGIKLQIISAFSVEHIKGFVFVEAVKQSDASEACRQLADVYYSLVARVPKNEVSHLLAVRRKQSEVMEGMWARVKNGIYKGDLAQVVAVNNARQKATVKLIPRIDLQALAGKFGGAASAKKVAVPAPRLISSTDLEEFRRLVQYKRDRDTGKHFEVLDGLMLKDGYLYKKLSIDSLSFWDVNPSEEELQKFSFSSKGGSDDLEWLSQLYGEQKKKHNLNIEKGGGKGEGSSGSSTMDGFEVHDLVVFGKKEFGMIVGMEKDENYKILKDGSDSPTVVTLGKKDLKIVQADKKFTALDHRMKTISINDTIKILDGASKQQVAVFRAMSLSSQNASAKDRVKKIRREDGAKLSLCEGTEDAEGTSEFDSDLNQKKKKRRAALEKRMKVQQEREMKKLENFLFGSLYSPVEFGKGNEDDKEVVQKNSAFFIMDRSAGSALSVYEEDAEFLKENDDETGNKQRKPAWVDEEEERTTINIAKVNRLRKLRKEEDETIISGSDYVSRLRAQHAKLNPNTEWAHLDSDAKSYSSDEESGVEDGSVMPSVYNVDKGVDILQSNEEIVVKSRVKLLPGILEYSRLVDANIEDPSNGPINSVQFHRNAQLLLAAGLDRKLRFFQIDGKRNTKIQSIFLDDCPIRRASFLPDGSQVIASGRRKFFYSFDLVKAEFDKIGPLTGREEKSLEVFAVSPDSSTIAFLGNEGYILLVSLKTKALVGTIKMNGTARSLAFTRDGQQLLSSGGDGHVYFWDLRTRTCLHKGVDEGCINGTALCTAPLGNLFAAGSSSGIVNIYHRDEFLGGKRKPLKTVENVTTEVDFLKFNHDAQILAVCSNMKKSSLKLIHIPSFTVFSNWPPPNQTLHYPRCLDFSPGGGFMAIGNAAGKVLLYKLHHYHHA